MHKKLLVKNVKSETCLGRPHISKMELFETIVNSFYQLTIIANVYMLDICRSFLQRLGQLSQ